MFFFQNVCVQRLAADDEEFASEARNAFAKLEEGDQQSLKDWEICRHLFHSCHTCWQLDEF